MSARIIGTSAISRTKPIPVRWAILGGAALGLIVLLVMKIAEGAEPLDPTTIVPPERLVEVGQQYRHVTFNLLSSFPYGEAPGADPSVVPVSEVVPQEVQRLDGQRVGVGGFMLPLDFNGQGVSEFVLNASYDMCYFGAPTAPNQFVVVKMKNARRTRFVHTPIIVFGTLTLVPERRDGRLVSLYRMEADSIGIGAGR